MYAALLTLAMGFMGHPLPAILKPKPPEPIRWSDVWAVVSKVLNDDPSGVWVHESYGLHVTRQGAGWETQWWSWGPPQEHGWTGRMKWTGLGKFEEECWTAGDKLRDSPPWHGAWTYDGETLSVLSWRFKRWR